MKIRAKLSLTYLTVSLLAMACMGTIIYFYVKETLTSQMLSHLESVSSIQSNRIKSIIDQNLERIRLVSSRTQLRISLDEYIKKKDQKHFTKLNLILKDALSSIDSFRVISLLNKEGIAVASTNADHLNVDYSHDDFYKTATSRNVAEHFFLDNNKELKLHLSGPLEIGGRLIGILLIESDALNIVSLLSDYSGLGKTGETVLGRKDSSGKLAQFIAPLRFDKQAALQRYVELSRHSMPMAIALSKKRQSITSGIDYRNQEVLAVTNYIDFTNWGLVVKIDQEEAFAPINDLLKYILALSLALIIVIAWVSFAVAKIISDPIINLTETAHDIYKGDLTKRANISSEDEVGELARTFNNMANGLIHTQQELKNSNKELESHRDHLEELVEQRTQEIQDKNKELESFSYSVSHDLRSPLRAIHGFSSIIMEDYKDALGKEGNETFIRIQQACKRMDRLIDDLLDLSRVNLTDMDRKKIDLGKKARATIERLESIQADPDLEFNLQPDLYAYGDDTLLEIVMSNLVTNAWKYTSDDRPRKIEVGKLLKDGESIYYVRDNGIGFDMKYSNKLFKAFQRLVADERYPGTGIGLATVSRIINRHGGKIWAESEPDKGATFYFTLPENSSDAPDA